MSPIVKQAKKYPSFRHFAQDQYAEHLHIISIRAISEHLNCTYNAVRNWVDNGGPKNLKILRQMAEDFDCTVEELRIIRHYFKYQQSSARQNEKEL